MFLASNRSTIFSPTFITLLVARDLAPAAHGITQENYLRVNLYGRPPSRTPRKQAPNVEFALAFASDFPPNVSVKSGIIYDTAASSASNVLHENGTYLSHRVLTTFLGPGSA